LAVEETDMPRARVVDQLTLHGAPVDFRELCVRAVPAGARTLLLDLDRTVHLDRNMGELLGWEICALHGYGEDRLAALEAARKPGRFALDWSDPGALLRYVGVGARMWAMPGLYYFLWGKLAWASAPLRRLSFRALGPEPVRAAQRVPQTALMHHMAELPLGTLRDLAARVLRRHEGEQTILREDLAWLRRRCPELRIVLTSASPAPMVEVAAEELGVDDVVSTTIEEREGFLSAPAARDFLYQPAARPRRISPPAAVQINASHAKIAEISRRAPEALAADADAVGITDTGYGEDHCWAQHLRHVVDVNSTAPFPPIVEAASPLRSIHSAALLTRAERDSRDAGALRLDPRRKAVRAHAPVTFRRAELEPALEDLVGRVETLLARGELAERACAAERSRADATLRGIEARVAALVDAYNHGDEGERPGALGRLRALSREEAHARREAAKAARPASEAAHALAEVLAEARARVEAMVDEGPAERALAAAG
jgi:hypothetical protein